ncbi:MAG TPA: PPOX class F420-dependent oxidoreductase [Dehalococcoidia bacterium]|nr:PPOX class F420-dependent oxidoreductase [Dehalococcoidia bacterium]
MDFDDPTRALLDGKNFAVVATLLPDGRPQTSVIWFKRDGDTVLFTTTDRRQKARNLQRDPRVSLTVFDPNDPYRTVEIRGTVEIMPDPERHLSRELTNRYLGTEPPPDHEGESRRIVRVRPEKVVVFSA